MPDMERSKGSLQEKVNSRVDALTGVLDRSAAEDRIRQTMSDGGALLLCDLDRFARINEVFGHPKGDACLKKAASMLSDIVRKQDVTGRLDGDAFVIFAYGSQSGKTVELIRNKIYRCFKSYNLSAEIPMTMTVGGAVYGEGDTYESLYSRAEQELQELKRRKWSDREARRMSADPWLRDLKTIRTELTNEMTENSGAFCPDYDSFKMIYRYLERSMRRANRKCCLMLFSLGDSGGDAYLLPDSRESMEQLGDILQKNLRMGDVFTRYSSC